jgi:tellurite methyltransferase
MLRAMLGFHEDPEGHWVAELSCGHSQHVRHQPPFTLRPWTLTAEGRAERVGQELDCPLCDRREIPAGHVAYKRTAPFQRETIPARLLQHHDTKPGVWAILAVTRGNLDFFEKSANDETRTTLGVGRSHVIVPEVEHRVAAQGEVEFSVEFWRRPP